MCLSTVEQGGTVPVPVSVPGKRFRRNRFRVRFLQKRSDGSGFRFRFVNVPLLDPPIGVGQHVEPVVMSGSGMVLSLTRMCFACLAYHLHHSSHVG